MALIKRVLVNQEKQCTKCKKSIEQGSEAIKDRRAKYKITPAKNGEKKKIERDFTKPTEYYHIDCYSEKGIKK